MAPSTVKKVVKKGTGVNKSVKSNAAEEANVIAPVVVDPVVVDPVVVDPVGVDPVVVEPSIEKTNDSKKDTESIENAFVGKLNNFIAKVSFINKEVKELQSIGKTLEKDFNNVIKVLSKQKNKNKNNENRSGFGFAMPSLLSDELYDFLKLEKGTLIPRNVVTRMLNEYIKSNNLRNDSDKRKLLPDDKLKKIFNCTDKDDVTYFNLQTYIKHHFIKNNSLNKQTDSPVVANVV